MVAIARQEKTSGTSREGEIKNSGKASEMQRKSVVLYGGGVMSHVAECR